MYSNQVHPIRAKMMRLVIVVATLGLAHLAESGIAGPGPFGGHNHGRNGHERPVHGHHDHNFGGHKRPIPSGPGNGNSVPTTTTTRKPVSGNTGNVAVETKTLDQLYADAQKEGCKLIVYAGGDTAGQQDYNKNAFEQRFPNCTLEMIVDYSKFHGPRINMQLENNNLIPDVAQLQTVQDFPRWKKQGVLMRYKPNGWNAIYDDYKDSEGDYVGVFIITFTNCINSILMPDQSTWPTEANDYLRADLKGHLAITYPNDDDAVLFLYKMIIDKYGWQYFEKLAAQNVTWLRGTHAPGVEMRAGNAWAAQGVSCGLTAAPGSPTVGVLPKSDPFMSWAQLAAIFKDAKNPASAKLYINFLVDKERQTNGQWSVRSDVPAPAYGPLSNYRSQTNPADFNVFMEDRAYIEDMKARIAILIGEPRPGPSTGNVSMYQAVALPHV